MEHDISYTIIQEDSPPLVLLIEDDIVIAEYYKSYLKTEQITLVHLQTGKAALEYLQDLIPVAILLDLGLPDMNGIEILKYVRQQQLGSAVIVITAEDSFDVVVEVMRYGAFDFIKKPFIPNHLVTTLRKILNGHNLNTPTNLNSPTKFKEIKQYHQFIGASPPMQEVYQIITKVSTSNAPVFITGETGTGKELCALALHQESPRKDKPFIALNCAAIPHGLMESELFGHLKGSFTGANHDRQGAASLANDGVLFLDEIGDMDLSLQRKLLRFLETSSFHKVGTHHLEKVNIRILCGTHRDPIAEIKAGRFREDLYHRLDVITIELPPLRERGEDMLLLANSFLETFTQAEPNKDFNEFSLEAQKILLHYKWPGNVRQLRNTIHSVVLLNEGKVVTADMLLAKLAKNQPEEPKVITSAELIQTAISVNIMSANTIRPLWQIEKDVLLKTIEYCNGSVEKAAKLLKIGPATIYRKKRRWKAHLLNHKLSI